MKRSSPRPKSVLMLWILGFYLLNISTAKALVQGESLMICGNYAAAKAVYLEARQQGASTNNRALIFESLFGLGEVSIAVKDFELAKDYFHQAMASAHTEEDSIKAWNAQIGLLWLMKDYDVAVQEEKIFRRWMANSGNIGYHFGQSLKRTSRAMKKTNRLRPSVRLLQKSLEVFRLTKDTLQQHVVLSEIIQTGINMKSLVARPKVRFYLNQSFALSQQQQDSISAAMHCYAILDLLAKEDSIVHAAPYLDYLLNHQWPQELTWLHYMGLYYRGRLAETAGNFDLALASYSALNPMLDALHSPQSPMRKSMFSSYLAFAFSKKKIWPVADTEVPEKTPAALNLIRFNVFTGNFMKAEEILYANLPVLPLYFNVLVWVLKDQGLHPRAYDFIRENLGRYDVNMSRSLNNKFNSVVVSIIRDVEEREKILLMRSRDRLLRTELAQERLQARFSVLGGFLFFLLATILYYLFRLKQKSSAALRQKNQAIRSSLAEKEILLKEIHHRVKNNLQTISSLLSLQARYVADPKALDAIREGQNRVHSMALIHQRLYQNKDLRNISAANYICQLSAYLFETYNIDSEKIKLCSEIDQIELDIDTIIPLGLILNELITNALKHAFPGKETGIINISLKRSDRSLVLLEVRDNGIGLNPRQNTFRRSFGLMLVETFALKLNADLKFYAQSGTRVQLKMKLPPAA